MRAMSHLGDGKNEVDVRVRIGAIYHRFADGRKVAILPLIEVAFPKAGKLIAEHLTAAAYPVAGEPDKVCVLVRSPNDPPLPHAARGLTAAEWERRAQAFVVYVADRKEWEDFDRLRSAWGYWYLRLSATQPGEPSRDYQVCEPKGGGNVYPIDAIEAALEIPGLLKGGPPDALRRQLAAALLKGWRSQGRDPLRWDFALAKKLAAEQAEIYERLGGPLPWTRWEGPKSDREATVEFYEQALYYLRRQMTDAAVDADPAGRQVAGLAMFLWTLLRNARIFELGQPACRALRREVDRFTTESVAQLSWLAPGEKDEEARKTAAQYAERIVAAGRDIELPDRLPFDICYFAWGLGWALSGDEMALRSAARAREGGWTCISFAHLVTATGWVVEFIWLADPLLGETLYWFIHRAPEAQVHQTRFVGEIAGWRSPMTLAPWFVTAAVRAVMDHRTIHVGQSVSVDLSRGAAPGRGEVVPAPPPYYLVPLRDQVIRAAVRRFRPRRKPDWQYSWEVEGHEVVRVRRGPLPLPEADRQEIRRAGYIEAEPGLYVRHYSEKIGTAAERIAEADRVLAGRAVLRRRPGEWMTVCVSFREDYRKQKDKPFVPAVRRPIRIARERGEAL